MNGLIAALFYIAVAICLLQFIVAVLFLIRVKAKRKPAVNSMASLSIIIPFHNEAKRILPLLESLNKQQFDDAKTEIIFANDASTDDTEKIISTHLKLPFKLITSDTKIGKKKMLDLAIQKTHYDHLLTLDADVVLPANYIRAVMQLNPNAAMIVLPVNMDGNTLVQQLGSVEFGWLQWLTFGLSKPLLCNGANLLFKKEAYQKVRQYRTDFDLASGDDFFLLDAFKKKQLPIERLYQPELTVSSPAPENFTTLLQQRKRWSSKISGMDQRDFFPALALVGLVQIAFFSSIFGLAFSSCFLIPLLFKLVTEFFLNWSAHRGNILKSLGIVFLHQLWYPLYLIALIFNAGDEARWDTK